jgi:iodotyrosine deiodinase
LESYVHDKVEFYPFFYLTRKSPQRNVGTCQEFREEMQRRRTIRTFSSRSVSRGIIEECPCAAGAAPNGVNTQPFHFVVVSNPDVKKQICEAAEAKEHESYERHATGEWLEAMIG